MYDFFRRKVKLAEIESKIYACRESAVVFAFFGKVASNLNDIVCWLSNPCDRVHGGEWASSWSTLWRIHLVRLLKRRGSNLHDLELIRCHIISVIRSSMAIERARCGVVYLNVVLTKFYPIASVAPLYAACFVCLARDSRPWYLSGWPPPQRWRGHY